MPHPSGPPAARQSGLREANLALVLRTVCAAREPVSRAGVAAATSMTRSTVSRLVDELVAAGLVDELDPPSHSRPGRPATPLAPGRRVLGLGLQVDVGRLAARVVDLRGEVVAEEVVAADLAGSSPRPTLRLLAALSRGVLASVGDGSRVVGAGLALPGIVASDAGRLLRAPNLGWSDVDVAALVPEDASAGLPLRLGNEASLAAMAVAEPAPGRRGPLADFLYLSGEVGIGGAVVVDGRVVGGRHGWAGEVGHVCVDPAGPACRCGSTGCLELYAGRNALLAAAGLPQGSATRDLLSRSASGDHRAREAVARAASALGVALSGVVNVLDVPAIVLGGHLGQVAELVRPDLEDALRRRVLSARWVVPEVTTAPEDDAPGATGAALAALASVLDDPARALPALRSA
ncbi:ROK family protein [Oryzobacter sp. R7]|uniref:ROK family transcriptional regulator n=1 Tax=Oryzobacter faecalis TaxID=3388656 RepID=UPI00398D3C9E